MLYSWQEAAIRGFAPSRQRVALLAALKREWKAAERALKAKHRRQRDEEAQARTNLMRPQKSNWQRVNIFGIIRK
jgi:hypothetical protein